MIWAVLAFLGVPLWLCAAGILLLLFNNRRLRKRSGDIPVRVRRAGKRWWRRGHAVWVSDVFAWRASPAGWAESLDQVMGVAVRSADTDDLRKLHGLGDEPVIATLQLADGTSFDVAAAAERRADLSGPFG